MKILAACVAIAFTLQVKAAEIKLAVITTDTLTDTTVFYLDTNSDGSAQGFRYVTTNENGAITEDVHNTVAEVLDDGSVLEEMEGREIVRLFLEEFTPVTGGKLRLNFLSNGVTGNRGNTYMKLVKTPTGFSIADTNGQLINKIFIKGNWSRLLRRWIGVSSIQGSFGNI